MSLIVGSFSNQVYHLVTVEQNYNVKGNTEFCRERECRQQIALLLVRVAVGSSSCHAHQIIKTPGKHKRTQESLF